MRVLIDERTATNANPNLGSEFNWYYPCGAFADRWCTLGNVIYTHGFRVPHVPQGTNDDLSSLEIIGRSTNQMDFFVIIFLHSKFGGRRAMGFQLLAHQPAIQIPSLDKYRRLAGKSWDNCVSSYLGYFKDA